MSKWLERLKDSVFQTKALQVSGAILLVVFYFVGVIGDPFDPIKIQDYKPLLEKFTKLEFKEIDYVPWAKIEKDCFRYNQTKHTTILKIASQGEEALMLMARSPTWRRIFVTILENYSKNIDEGFGPEVDNSYISEKLFNDIGRNGTILNGMNRNDLLLATHWKNLVIKNKCYHLLDNVTLFDGLESDVPQDE